MKLSVIVPIYNVENYIVACLESLINQTYQDFEILLVNDGSKDQSIQKIQVYLDQHKHFIRLLNKQNGGLSDARNYGIDHSRGDYLAFIDSDDSIHPEMFEKMMNRLLETGSDICSCDMEYVYRDHRRERSSGRWIEGENQFSRLLSNNSACNKIYKRELFFKHRFPVGRWYEDLATIPVIVYAASKFEYVPEVFYYYNQREGSIAHLKNEKMFDIYWAIGHIENLIGCASDSSWNEVKHEMVINHGLFLTGLRIKKMKKWKDRSEYNKMNAMHATEMHPDWSSDSYLREFPIKMQFVFKLLSLRLYGLLALIYKG